MTEFKMSSMSSLYSDGVFYNLKKAAEAAIASLVWSEEPDGEDWSRKYVSKELTWSVIMDIADYCSRPEVQAIFEAHQATINFEELGHKFYLSANGHGTGIWDSELPDSETLHELAEGFERRLYCDEDDQLRSE